MTQHINLKTVHAAIDPLALYLSAFATGGLDTLMASVAVIYDPDIEALLGGGPSPLDRPLNVTFFPKQSAQQKRERLLSLRDLASIIMETNASGDTDEQAKTELPWLKLARFGNRKTDKGALRSNMNVEAISGVEIDYDGGELSIEDACRMLEAARVSALAYETATSRPEKHKWRVLCPLSQELPGSERERLVRRLNGLFAGKIDQGASFTLSQAFYYGGIQGRRPDVAFADGRFLDLADDLDARALEKVRPTSTGKSTSGKVDERALLDAITAGEDYHGSTITLAGYWATKGVGFVDAFAKLQKAFDEVPKAQRDGRWSTRRGDIQGVLAHVYGKESAKDLPEPIDVDTAFDSEPEGEKTVAGFALDHDGVIRAFTKRYRGKLKFDHDAGSWFRFDGSHWQAEKTKLAHHFARKTSTEMARANPKDGAVKALKSVPTWEAIERGARTDRNFAVTADTWDCDLMLLGTPGGTVDLRTGELRPADPADHISKVTAVAPIPLANFVPERDCPMWLRFLDHALAGDAATIRLLQQWGGYSLTGDTKEQKLVFAYGPGGAGKGTAINTIGDIMGDYAVNVPMETLTVSKHDAHPTELARLRGARMARASETEKGRAWAENRIKVLTGQDTITARFMLKDFFEFKPQFKLTIFGNNAPSLKDVDAAIRRRFIIMPFNNPPAERDLDLPEKLKAEWPAILSWLIAGCLDWKANELIRPSVVNAATEAYFSEQDVFGQWLEECCEVGPSFVAKADDLWQSWQGYAMRFGEDPGSKKRTFPEHLSQRGFEALRNTAGIRGAGRRGVRLLEEAFDEDDQIG
ncbi:phage/plasmid primase, P4 family [Aureimonas pseudogalii]|uniref:P4 family phage/plasmid primase-like protein n=1 Tax=Aureimonas pseudogalii TaxID=1744844 RepID=A0A7W6MKB0_9HYPH|nr:phage/plasmid primase, P4 family [Aureimonas pseudogalii]MBB3998865.1 P4 family phage/plasmid primase-like protein [Aureimonas pseudogalii]